jgi:hypothetical protein
MMGRNRGEVDLAVIASCSYPDETVTTPRYCLVYRAASTVAQVLRLLHDSSDLARHPSW